MALDTHPATRRICARLAQGDPAQALLNLSPTDLHALQLALFSEEARRTSPAALLNRYAGSPYAQPAAADALALRRMEAELLSDAADAGFEPIQLSPVSPLGACSVIAAAHQNKIISAARGLEATADPTNALALYCCQRLRAVPAAERRTLHVSATHRVVRAQPFHRPGQVQHFTMLALVSAGRDGGSYTFEKEALFAHITLYRHIFATRFGKPIRLRLRRMPGYTDGEGLIDRLRDHIRECLPGLPVERHPEDGEGAYYRGMQCNVLIDGPEGDIAICDGGIVDWSQKLLSSRKERMFISAFGIDRVLSL